MLLGHTFSYKARRKGTMYLRVLSAVRGENSNRTVYGFPMGPVVSKVLGNMNDALYSDLFLAYHG